PTLNRLGHLLRPLGEGLSSSVHTLLPFSTGPRPSATALAVPGFRHPRVPRGADGGPVRCHRLDAHSGGACRNRTRLSRWGEAVFLKRNWYGFCVRWSSVGRAPSPAGEAGVRRADTAYSLESVSSCERDHCVSSKGDPEGGHLH